MAWTTAEQLQWLNTHVPRYLDAREKGTVADFFPWVCTRWREQFPSTGGEQTASAKGYPDINKVSLVILRFHTTCSPTTENPAVVRQSLLHEPSHRSSHDIKYGVGLF